MILKRCPSCQGVADVERLSSCFACGANIPAESPVLKSGPVSRALRVALQDKKTATGLLIGFALPGGLSVLGVLFSHTYPVLRFGLGILFLAAVVLGVRAMLGYPQGTWTRALLSVFVLFGILLLGAAAIAAGLFLLLCIACATGRGNPW